MRAEGLLGKSVMGKAGFDYDIRIQMGAGAYVCGEETALISSLEGSRGDPKTRPPFPAQRGYRSCPSVVNNVETLACVTKILEAGPATFNEYGSKGSSGTKLLSISGDCERPGIYEYPFGVTIQDILRDCGARDAQAVQAAGVSNVVISLGKAGALLADGRQTVFAASPTIEEIQDMVEKVLIETGHARTAKAYILYRSKRAEARETERMLLDAEKLVDDYLQRADWRVNENSNMNYSLQGLNFYLASSIAARYWLDRIYPPEVQRAHVELGVGHPVEQLLHQLLRILPEARELLLHRRRGLEALRHHHERAALRPGEQLHDEAATRRVRFV